MFYFAQVNIGVNPPSLSGLLQIIFGLLYFIFAIVKLVIVWNRISSLRRIFNIILLLIAPTFLIASGFILFFQGWRLDPILQLQQFILSLLIVLLLFKDIIINAVNRNR